MLDVNTRGHVHAMAVDIRLSFKYLRSTRTQIILRDEEKCPISTPNTYPGIGINVFRYYQTYISKSANNTQHLNSALLHRFCSLAGDVGRLTDYNDYLAFLEEQTSRYKTVLLVLGNHEFFGMNYEDGIDAAIRLAQEPSLSGRLVLLHQARWDSPSSETTILGCTLWSSISDDARDAVRAKVGDYKHIAEWTVDEHNSAHEQDLAWLQQEVASIAKEAQQRQLVIATHHAPSLQDTSHPQHVANPWTCSFATDLISTHNWNGVKAWIFGHTHYCTDTNQNGIRVVANQRGYVFPNQAKSPQRPDAKLSFDPTKTITIG